MYKVQLVGDNGVRKRAVAVGTGSKLQGHVNKKQMGDGGAEYARRVDRNYKSLGAKVVAADAECGVDRKIGGCRTSGYH